VIVVKRGGQYMRKKTKRLLLAGLLGINMGLATAQMPQVQAAIASYESSTYWSDVVKSSAEAKAVEPDADIVQDDNLILNHTESWGTRDCIALTMPEDGTLKLHMKNISDYTAYGSQLEIYANENFGRKLSATIDVDGGGEGDTSIYLEKGTYYIYVTSSNYDGNEFIEGDSRLSRTTQLWAGYVPQAPIFSVKGVELSEDKSSATITLNLPEAYSTLRVEDYYIDYEDLKNGTVWETSTRTNMIEYDTYEVTKNGWYTFRLVLNDDEEDAKGWGFLCRVKVSGIGNEEYQELGEATGELPEITVGDSTKEVASVTSIHDFKNKISQEIEPFYTVHAYKKTTAVLPITMKEAGTLSIGMYIQASQSTYNKGTLTLYSDKNMTMKLSSMSKSTVGYAYWSLLPGTYYLKVETAENSSQLNGTLYAERAMQLYFGYFESKQAVKEIVTLSEDKSSANVQLQIADVIKCEKYGLYDYKVNKYQISNSLTGSSMTVKYNTFDVTQNGEYTIYVKGEDNDHPGYFMDTFVVSGINGVEYERETAAAPHDNIPYAHSVAELLDNIVAGQKPFISIPYQETGNATENIKIEIPEDTYIFAYAGGTGGTLSFYNDFQYTDLYKKMTFGDTRVAGNFIKAGTYYVEYASTYVGVGSTDGAYYYAQSDLYLGGIKASDMVKVSSVTYNEEKTSADVTLRMINDEKIGTVEVHNQHYEVGESVTKDSLVGTYESKSTINLTKNGDYTLFVWPKNTTNIGKNYVCVYVTLDELVEDTTGDDATKDDTGNSGNGTVNGDTTNSGDGTANGDTTNSGDGTANGDSTNSGNGTVNGDTANSGNGTVNGDTTNSGNGTVNGDTTNSGNGTVNGDTTNSGSGSTAKNDKNQSEANTTSGKNSGTSSNTVKPAKVTISSAKNSKGKKLVLKWKKVKGASGYEVTIATKKNFKKGKKVTSVKGTSKTFKKLKKNKTYYVKVRAYTKKNGKKVYGAYSKVKKVKITK
jgi:hypothetical protein